MALSRVVPSLARIPGWEETETVKPWSQRWASSCSGRALGVLAEWAADGGLIPFPPGSPTLFPQSRNFGFPAGDPT